MSTSPRRIPWGVARYAVGLTTDVFLADEWLEVDEMDYGEIRRMRVPYDEVRLVTSHDERPVALLILGALFGLPLAGFGAVVAVLQRGQSGGTVAGAILLTCGLLLLVPTAIVAWRGIRVITVCGERSKALVRFSFRHAKADAARETVLARVRRARRVAESRTQAPGDAAPEEGGPGAPSE